LAAGLGLVCLVVPDDAEDARRERDQRQDARAREQPAQPTVHPLLGAALAVALRDAGVGERPLRRVELGPLASTAGRPG